MPEVSVEATDWQGVAEQEATKNLQLRAAISAAARKLVDLENELAAIKGKSPEDGKPKRTRSKPKSKGKK